MPERKVVKINASYYVCIPAHFAQSVGINENIKVDVSMEDGKIIITKVPGQLKIFNAKVIKCQSERSSPPRRGKRD